MPPPVSAQREPHEPPLLTARIKFPGGNNGFVLSQGGLNGLYGAVRAALGEGADGHVPRLTCTAASAKKDESKLANWLGAVLLRAAPPSQPEGLVRWQRCVMGLAVGGCTRSDSSS